MFECLGRNGLLEIEGWLAEFKVGCGSGRGCESGGCGSGRSDCC